MRLSDLNEDQRLELKQSHLTNKMDERGESPSYGELAEADSLVSDSELEKEYGGTEFSPDDFCCSCHGRTVKVERIPQWAVCYLVNADDSGLTPEDKKMVDDYVERLLKEEHLRLICPIGETASEFEPHPAFGLASGTVDFAAEELRDGESD